MVAWAVLEGVVETALVKELGLGSQRGLIVTTGMQFRQRTLALIGLLEKRSTQPHEAIALLKKVEKIAKRNAIVHGHVVVGVPGQLTFVKSNVNEGYSARAFTFTGPALEGHIARLTEETNRLQRLLNVSDQDIQSVLDVAIAASGHAP